MTMPHLMNCPHSEDGWCLGCVKALWEERRELEEECQRLEAGDVVMEQDDPPSKTPWPLFCDVCDRREEEPFDYGDKCPACHGKLRHEYDVLLHTLDSYAGGGKFMVPAMQAARAIRWLRADLYGHLAKSGIKVDYSQFPPDHHPCPGDLGSVPT